MNMQLGRPALLGSTGLFAAGQNVARNRNWLDELGNQYAEDFFIYDAVVPTLAAGTSAVAQIPIMQDSAFEWMFAVTGARSATTGVTWRNDTPAITVMVTDNMSGRNLFSAPVMLSTLGGSAEFPFPLPVPRRFMPTSTINVFFSSFETATTWSDVRLSLIGRKIFLNGRRAPNPAQLKRFRSWQGMNAQGEQSIFTEDLYAYSVTFPVMAANTTVTAQQLIDGDSDFEWLMTNGSIGTTGGNIPQIPVAQQLITLDVQDGGSGNRSLSVLSNGGVNTYLATQCGAQGTPFILPVPRVFLSKTQINFTLTNIDTGTAYGALNLVLWGRKIFQLG